MSRTSTLLCRIGQLSLAVAVVSLLRGHFAGCGECVEALSSKWAVVMGVPVSLAAVVLYLVALSLSWAGTSEIRGAALGFCGGLILMAAACFTAIQAFRIGSVCVHCALIHGFAVLGVVLISRGMNPTSPKIIRPGLRLSYPFLIGAVCSCGFAAVLSLDPGEPRDGGTLPLLDTKVPEISPGTCASQQPLQDGPQIKFDAVSLKTSPIAMGETANATFEFTNIGSQTLLIHAIHTGCGCVVAVDWSHTVRPGERGSVSFIYNTEGKEAEGLGEHIRHVWIASNSVVRTDPSYGDRLEMIVPVTTSTGHTGARMLTATGPPQVQ